MYSFRSDVCDRSRGIRGDHDDDDAAAAASASALIYERRVSQQWYKSNAVFVFVEDAGCVNRCAFSVRQSPLCGVVERGLAGPWPVARLAGWKKSEGMEKNREIAASAAGC